MRMFLKSGPQPEGFHEALEKYTKKSNCYADSDILWDTFCLYLLLFLHSTTLSYYKKDIFPKVQT